jgi:peptidyl-dipeptidase A
VARSALGPWAWSEPFAQEDPLDVRELDRLVEGVDIESSVRLFYERMGIDVGPILRRSDMQEREGKNQHAFCIHIDRRGDIRTLNNIRPSIKWLETLLHELGHAIYEMGLDPTLPWLLREPPHMITTEAMALLAGRQAYRIEVLPRLLLRQRVDGALLQRAEASLGRRQLIFCRWVLVMSFFERGLYQNPTQDLNTFWWQCVERYQQIVPPKNRQGKCDWATKYHLGLAPVYYFSYLLGEMLASSIQEKLRTTTQISALDSPAAGTFLQNHLFAPGNRMPWHMLVAHLLEKPLDRPHVASQSAGQPIGQSLHYVGYSSAWIREFC